MSEISQQDFMQQFGELLKQSMKTKIPEKIDPKYAKYGGEELNHIILPPNMSLLEGSKELKRMYEENQTDTVVLQQYPEWHWKDVLVAFKKATIEMFGWTNAVADGLNKPIHLRIIVDVKNGKKIYEDCFYGVIRIPAWKSEKTKEFATCEVGISRDGVVSIGINTVIEFKQRAQDFLSLVEVTLNNSSIYRNRALRVVRGSQFGGFEFEIMEILPNYNIILNTDTQRSIDRDINYELSQSDKKRTYLFLGQYGNGNIRNFN